MDSAAFNMSHPSNFILAVVSGTIGAIGAPGNLFLLCFILVHYKTRKPHDWLLFTLAVGDFVLCLNNAALEAPFIVHFDTVQCKVAGAIEYAFGMLSLLTPPLVAYNRYLALYDKQKYSRLFTTPSVFLMWASLLLFALSCITPFALTDSLGQDDLGLCGTQVKNTFLASVAAFATSSLVASYGFLAYFSYKVITKIKNHKREGALRSRLQSRLVNESQDIITAILTVSTVPLFTQVPAVLIKFMHVFTPPIDPWISRAVTSPFPLTSAVNAYVTAYVVKDYRKKIIKLFKNGVSPRNGPAGSSSRANVIGRNMGSNTSPF